MKKLIEVPESYSYEHIEQHKCRPFIDKTHEKLINDLGKRYLYPIDDTFKVAGFLSTKDIFNRFKRLLNAHISGSKLNNILNLDNLPNKDIILGCTQYIDNLHIKHKDIQVLEKEYNYHTRLRKDLVPTTIEQLKHNVPLIISIPFAHYGKKHPRMQEILDICLERNIDVHLDAAWLTACKNIDIDLSHPSIKSFAVSLSKGYGLSGWNRIGLRYSKTREEDSITVMNDHLQIPSVPVLIGTYFMEHIDIDHLWTKHSDNYYKICKDFNLETTDTIHMGIENTQHRGIAPLLRYLESDSDSH